MLFARKLPLHTITNSFSRYKQDHKVTLTRGAEDGLDVDVLLDWLGGAGLVSPSPGFDSSVDMTLAPGKVNNLFRKQLILNCVS